MLDNTLNRSVDLKNDPQKHVLCAEDETVPEEQKVRFPLTFVTFTLLTIC